jgi:hypothetical protein
VKGRQGEKRVSRLASGEYEEQGRSLKTFQTSFSKREVKQG